MTTNYYETISKCLNWTDTQYGIRAIYNGYIVCDHGEPIGDFPKKIHFISVPKEWSSYHMNNTVIPDADSVYVWTIMEALERIDNANNS